MRNIFIAALAASAFVSGCGGGSTQSTQSTFPAFPAAGSGPFTLNELQSYVQINAVDVSNLIPVRPGTPSATYNGMIIFTETTSAGDVDYLGRATLNANFNSGALTGTTSDYALADTTSAVPNVLQTVSGTIPISNGSIVGPVFTADLDGQLNDGGTLLNVDSVLTGTFASSNGQNIAAGDVGGTMNANSLDGAFLAVQP